ncbi:hypothetical protein LNKW23_48800 [Paralimibaculum aggregatum]|uniref:Biopolymer transporter ExbD n=1 Tax=Paralimibaculum aggregatum TaxID=3036245 RepID=A0ABQ6LUA5_9RHOB|nr:biopolymer transporter ExbD [Limibaculum sp. NKW23]GMG85655.1 hypothetical protein LNKW23_48800 [Limibaculum sp. NKW23]
MDFSAPRHRRTRDGAVPMINIVFLLLIFFLLTATLSTSAPFPLALPESRAEARAEEEAVLFVAADGRLAWMGHRDAAVYPAIAAAAAAGRGRIEIRADRDLPGPEIARILAALGSAGIAEVGLAVGRP